MKFACLLFVLMTAVPLHADELPNWTIEQPLAAVSHLTEPASSEVVVVINDNALGGNHAGLFAGKLLIDPAGSYFGVRTQDKDWSAPTLADYARYQTVDGLNIRLYRFSLQAQAFAAIVQRIHDAGATPPLFCASAVQNLLAGISPFDAIEPTGWTSPSALGHRLDPLTRGEGAIGICQKLDASPC